MSAADAYWQSWWEEAMQGRLVVPNLFMGDEASLFLHGLYTLRRRHRAGQLHLDKLELFVRCRGGDPLCWEAADQLCLLREDTGLMIRAEIHDAISAGLILAIVADYRICERRAHFIWHGSQSKLGHDESRRDDDARCRHMAHRTKRTFEWWMEKAASGDVYEFRGPEALEIGVVHEIGDLLL